MMMRSQKDKILMTCFSPLDRHFADLIVRLHGEECDELRLAALMVGSAARHGNTCLSIPRAAGRKIEDVIQEPTVKDQEHCGDELSLPGEKAWMSVLRKSSVTGVPGEKVPLVLDNAGRLYLHRYWEYEHNLAEGIVNRAAAKVDNVNMELLKKGLDRFFPDESAGGINWQRVAAAAAVMSRFCLITGGPGTGKTRTVVRILALLSEQHGHERGPVPVALCAPTGKAAGRMQEAIRSSLEELDCGDEIKNTIPHEASTLHRLLGTIPDSPYFRYDNRNRLPYNTVVLDEASMIDIALMAKLLDALKEDARLILVGDRDQLSSVEAGAVVGDICDNGGENTFSGEFAGRLSKLCGMELNECSVDDPEPLADSIVVLKRSYRFEGQSGIGMLSAAVRNGKPDEALSILETPDLPEIKLVEGIGQDQLKEKLVEPLTKGLENYVRAKSPEEAIGLLGDSVILCALRRGPYGVEHLNSLVEKFLVEHMNIQISEQWYHLRPVMVNKNDYGLRLFNGDIGVVFRETSGGLNRVYFASRHDVIRSVIPSRLPAHDTAFALTVHKSQGSEFENVILILPDRDYPVCTRELLYTAITRAKKTVEIWSSRDVLINIINRTTERASGLSDALRGGRSFGGL